MQDNIFQLLLYKIKNERGFDFSQYRPAILKRRIDGRLRARRVGNYIEYINLINRDPKEYEKLIDVATINVTEFFRDPAAWEVVEKKILTGLIQNKDQKSQRLIRVWSAGTSGGEEAYTLAILFHELLGRRLNSFRIKIYGTDIDRISMERAELGEYPPASVRNVPPSLLKKYFIFTGKSYAVADSLRLLVQFRNNNLATDEPLEFVDFIACRNVLIYFNRELQASVMEKFCRALHSGGYLMLGKSESPGAPIRKCFEAADEQERIYRKKED